MASLNLLQWREKSVWRRYRGLHSLGISLMLVISFFAAQWVTSYSDYLSYLHQQITDRNVILEKRKQQQQRWLAYQQQQKSRQAFVQQKQNDQLRLNAFYALLDKTQTFFHQRELTLTHSQFRMTAEYQQIQDVNDHYLWLEHQLGSSDMKQQLLPQQRVQFLYTGKLNKVVHNG